MKLNLKELLQDKFVRGTFFLTVANFGGAFLNYLVHPILTRHISVSAYGDFQALLSFITILGVLAAVVNTTLIKEISVLSAESPSEIKALCGRAAKRFFIFSLLVFILILIFTDPLNALFHISESRVLLIASLGLLYAFPLAIHRAVLSGRQHFPALALSSFLDAFSRIFFVVLLVVIWPLGLTGAAWALGLTGLIAFLFSFRQIKDCQLPDAASDFQPSLRRYWRYSLMVLWFMAVTQFFYNFDMLSVKAFFSPEQAGLYGALLTIGRIIYFVGGAVPLVMFPVIANLRKDQSLRRYAVLAKSLALFAALALPAYLVIALWPQFIINIIVGSKYLSMAPYLPGFALVMLALTILLVLSNYFLALSSRSSLIIMSVAAGVEIILLSFFHHSLTQVIISLGLAFGGGALGLLFLVLFEYNKAKHLYAPKD
jgi:O-antigen/teichoic acid export membrane protein